MCGRYSITSPGQVIAEIFGIDEPVELTPHYNVCPGQEVPVVRARHGAGDRTLGLLRWGLVPWFVKQPGPAARLINARAETAATSPAFREALRRRRCLLPADGFYEWQASAVRRGPKQPFFVRADQQPIALAGLWERWKGADGTRIESCTVLTTTPNERLREVHDRMPVILAEDAWSLWLDRDVQEVEHVRPLLVPSPADELLVTPVTTWVNDPQHDDAHCIAPPAPEPVDPAGASDTETERRVARSRHIQTVVLRRLLPALFLTLASVAPASAGCPAAPVELDAARFVPSGDAQLPASDAAFTDVRLPDEWRERLPGAGGLAWYRLPLQAASGGDPRCAVYLPDVNMNAAVFVNGQWIGEGGSLAEPVAHNFNRPLYFDFPAALLRGDADRIDVLLYAYAHHFGRLGPIWVGPHAALQPRYARALFRQITLAEIGTALALVTAALVGTIWVGAGFHALYGFFFASTLAWAVNSLNYWVSDIPLPHWAWDRLVNASLDQFAVFLALFFHRLVRVKRPRVERALAVFAIGAALAAFATPRPSFADAMMVTHALITMIGAYVTVLSWVYRRRLSRAEARVYLGAWFLQLVFSAHDLGIQLGLWRGVGYTVPYTVSCMMLAFGTTLALRFVQALREARALDKTLEERVREREDELSRQFARSRELEHRDILGRERQRLMREMHDGLGGQLVSSLALVEAGADADPELVAALRDSLDELRLVIFSLDPGTGEVPALLAALRGRLEPTLERRGARFRWRVGDAPTPARFGPDQFLNLLRIVQEAITNAIRHAAPTLIEVATSVDDGNLVIAVRDDGCGFPQSLQRGRGLTNMEHRARELGGQLHFASNGDGTSVELRLPLG